MSNTSQPPNQSPRLPIVYKAFESFALEIVILLLAASVVVLKGQVNTLLGSLKIARRKNKVPPEIAQDIMFWLHELLKELDCNGVMMYYKGDSFVATKPGYTLDKPHQLFKELKQVLNAEWVNFKHTSYGEYMIRGVIIRNEMCSYLLVYDIGSLSFVYDTNSVKELINCIERDNVK